MSINPNELVARAREHLTEQDESVRYGDDRIYALIPSALAEWIRRTELNPAKARNFLVETGDITIADGAADCSEALEAKGIQSQFVPTGDILVQYASAEFAEGGNVIPGEGGSVILAEGGNGGESVFNDDEAAVLPVQFVSTLSRLTMGGIQDKYFLTVYFDGRLMRFRNPADSSLDTLAGTMRIRAVSVPKTLVDIPASVEGELATILAELVRKFDTDREHKGVSLSMRQPR